MEALAALAILTLLLAVIMVRNVGRQAEARLASIVQHR